MSLLSTLAKILEKITLPYIANKIPHITKQYGCKRNHYWHSITQYKQFQCNMLQPKSTTSTHIITALNMCKTFGTLNIHKLILANIPNTITKFITNYIKKIQSLHNSIQKCHSTRNCYFIHTYIYTSDMPTLLEHTQLITYIAITAIQGNLQTAKPHIQPYPHSIHA